MSATTEVHDTNLCRCEMCIWAESASNADNISPRDRGMDDFILENELSDYADTYGEESLAVKLDQFMLQRGMY